MTASSFHDNTRGEMLPHTFIEAFSLHKIQQSLAVAIDGYGCGHTKMRAMAKNPPLPVSHHRRYRKQCKNRQPNGSRWHSKASSLVNRIAGPVGIQRFVKWTDLDTIPVLSFWVNQCFILMSAERAADSCPFRDDMALHFQNANKAGANMLEFTMKSLSTMVYKNPSVQVPGLVPYLGTSLELSWKILAGICTGIVLAQFLISIFIYISYVEHSEKDTAG